MKEILKRINDSQLSPNEYFLLYGLVYNLTVDNVDTEQTIKGLEEKGHMLDGVVVSSLFDEEQEDASIHMKAVQFAQIFPPIHLPTGVHARGKLYPLKQKLKAFLRIYNYDWDVIYEAADRYVKRYRDKGYSYMQNAPNFVLDKNGDSALALECDILQYNNVEDDNESI